MSKRTSSKRIQTRTAGVFYKEIISDSNKVVDKVYGIRYLDEDGKERLKIIGKYSEGIRANSKISQFILKVDLN